jgi:hypothetical protein
MAKSAATLAGLVLNFAGRRLLVFPERASGPWQRQVEESEDMEKFSG